MNPTTPVLPTRLQRRPESLGHIRALFSWHRPCVRILPKAAARCPGDRDTDSNAISVSVVSRQIIIRAKIRGFFAAGPAVSLCCWDAGSEDGKGHTTEADCLMLRNLD